MADTYTELAARLGANRCTGPMAVDIALGIVRHTRLTPINKNALYLEAIKQCLNTEVLANRYPTHPPKVSVEEACDVIDGPLSTVADIAQACHETLTDWVRAGHGNSGLDYTRHYLTALERIACIYRAGSQL